MVTTHLPLKTNRVVGRPHIRVLQIASIDLVQKY